MRPLVKETPFKRNADFEAMMSPYMHALRSHCQYVTRSKWDGEDLMQDVSMRLYQHWNKHQQPLSKSYILRAASNSWVDRLRKKKPNEWLTDEDFDYCLQKQSQSSESLEAAIKILLEACTPKQRTVLLLIDAFNFTSKETADVLGETEGSIKASLHRARKSIKKEMDIGSTDFDEELVSVYSHAIQQGHVDTFIRLYNQDIQAMYGGVNLGSLPAQNQMVQSIGRTTSGYMLVCVQLRSGKTLFIPVYHQEAGVMLTNVQVLNTAYTFAA